VLPAAVPAGNAIVRISPFSNGIVYFGKYVDNGTMRHIYSFLMTHSAKYRRALFWYQAGDFLGAGEEGEQDV
jgi:thiamine transporter ThiT